MNDAALKRIQELHQDFEVGQKRLREIDMQRTQLQETLLRISGALQVLQELVDQAAADPAAG